MANNPQNDFKKEIEEELGRALAKQKLIDIKLKLGGKANAQKEIDGLLNKERRTRNEERGIISDATGDDGREGQMDSLASSPGDKGGQKKSGHSGAKDNQPAEKKPKATKKESQQPSPENEPQVGSSENQSKSPNQEQKPPVGEKPRAEVQPPATQSPVEPQENQQPPPVATKPEAAEGQAEPAGQIPDSTAETAPAGQTPEAADDKKGGAPSASPSQEPVGQRLQNATANSDAFRRQLADERRQNSEKTVSRKKLNGPIDQNMLPRSYVESNYKQFPQAGSENNESGSASGRSKEGVEEARSPRQHQTDLDKKKKEAKAKQETVKAAVEGPAEIEGKLKKLKQIYRIINGTSALTLWGIIVTFLTMNAQLIFANASPIATLFKIPIPKLDLWEIGLLMLVDLVVCAFIFFVIIIIYFIIDCTGGIFGSKMLWCWVKM